MEHTTEIQEAFRHIKSIQFNANLGHVGSENFIMLIFDDSYSGNAFTLLEDDYKLSKPTMTFNSAKNEFLIHFNRKEDQLSISNIPYKNNEFIEFGMGVHQDSAFKLYNQTQDKSIIIYGFKEI